MLGAISAATLEEKLVNPVIPFLLVVAGAIIIFTPLTVAIGVTLGALTIILSLLRWQYGLWLVVLSIPFGSSEELMVGDFTMSASDFLIPILAMTWVVRSVARGEVRVQLTPIFVPFLSLWAVMALSTTNAISLGLSAKEMIKWTEFIVVFLLAKNTLVHRRDVYLLVAVLLGAGFLEAMHGWIQFMFNIGPESFLIAGRFLRAYGSFGQPNPYGGYLGLILPISLALFVGSFDQRPFLSWRKALALGMLFLTILAAMVMSLSRGAWLGFISAALVIALAKSRKTRIVALILVFTIALVALIGMYDLIPGEIRAPFAAFFTEFSVFDPREAFVTPENYSIVERMAQWYAAWNMFLDYPLIGLGIGNFKAFYPEYTLPQFWLAGQHAHNYYLNTLAETGILGLTAYLLFVVSSFLYVIGIIRRLAKQGQEASWIDRSVALGVLGVLVALSVHNLFDNLFVHSMVVHVGIVLGLLGPLVGKTKPESRGGLVR